MPHIDGVYFTHDATITGDFCRVVMPETWWRFKKMHSIEYALDTTPVVYTTGTGQRGEHRLVIPWCPAVIFTGLRAFADGTAHHTFAFTHTQMGALSLEVQVLSLIAASDEQWIVGDPIENLTIRLAVFGTI